MLPATAVVSGAFSALQDCPPRPVIDSVQPLAATHLGMCRLEKAGGLTFDDDATSKAHDAINFAAMASELVAVEALCSQTNSPVVFCHNDLLSGNILVLGQPPGTDVASLREEQLQLQLIDFEYGCFSYRGFDWGALQTTSATYCFTHRCHSHSWLHVGCGAVHATSTGLVA
jgi:Choline/ethanolamine kinase